MPPETKYWFPARRHGWGWSIPTVWQGWVVLSVYVGLLMGSSRFLAPGSHLHVPFIGVVSVIFVTILWIKGEPPRWPWSRH